MREINQLFDKILTDNVIICGYHQIHKQWLFYPNLNNSWIISTFSRNTSFIKMVSKGKIWKHFGETSHEDIENPVLKCSNRVEIKLSSSSRCTYILNAYHDDWVGAHKKSSSEKFFQWIESVIAAFPHLVLETGVARGPYLSHDIIIFSTS